MFVDEFNQFIRHVAVYLPVESIYFNRLNMRSQSFLVCPLIKKIARAVVQTFSFTRKNSIHSTILFLFCPEQLSKTRLISCAHCPLSKPFISNCFHIIEATALPPFFASPTSQRGTTRFVSVDDSSNNINDDNDNVNVPS